MAVLGIRRVIALFCYVNALININRSIVSGAPESFQTFISKSLDVSVERQNFYLGLLASAYVASALLFSVVFGYLSIGRNPIKLIAWGLVGWMVSAVVSGMAYHTTSYYLLLAGRILAGIGEASFQCLATPLVNQYAPEKTRTLWLGVFIASVIVGIAAGYIYGSAFAESSLTWAAGFYLEIVLMAPAIALIVFCIPDEMRAVPVKPLDDLSGMLVTTDDRDMGNKTSRKTGVFLGSWGHVLRNTPFLLLSFGYSSYTFMTGCLATFSPTLLIGLGFFESEGDASFLFGIIVLVSGACGALLGGYVLDRLAARDNATPAKRARNAIDLLFYLMILVVGCGVLIVVFSTSKTATLLLFGIAYSMLAAMNPAQNVAAMELFPASRQAMAIAANCAIFYTFGDIPSPVVIGWLKDSWAPRCGTVEIDGDSQLNPDCYLDRSGLKHVLLFAVLWLLWAVVLWGAAKFTLQRQRVKDEATVESPAAVR